MRNYFLLAFLLVLLAPMAAEAQNGKISGTVIDRATHESLPGATIVIEGTTRGTSTDVDGKYVLLDMPPGTHVLRASFVGFGAQVVQDVEVASNFTTIVDFSLSPGVELEEVVVLSQRLIRQDEVSTTTVMQGAEIQSLPVDTYQQAVTLAAGVTESNSGSDQGLHFRGGRGSEVAYIIDGVFVEDPLSGTDGGLDVARQAIDELQILTGGFSAKYGKAMSGLILINTPVGTNEYHGSIRVETDGYSMEGLGGGGTTSSDYRRPYSNDWGTRRGEFSFTGPLLRDRVTFFLAVDRQDTDTYLNEFEGPVRPAIFPWGEMAGRSFLRTVNNSFVDAEGNAVDIDLDGLGIKEGDVITQDLINQLTTAGVDVDRLGTVAVSDYQQDHQLGLYNDRTRLTANLGIKVSKDIDARLGYILTRREFRNYQHAYKFLPQYNNTFRRNVDLFNVRLTHRISPSVFYQVRGSYINNRFFDFLYEEELDADDPFRFGRLFDPASVLGAFNTEGLSDAEGGNNYDFRGHTNQEIYSNYPHLLDGDLGNPLLFSKSLDLDGDGVSDVHRGDPLTQALIDQLRGLFASATDEELAELGLNRNLIPIQAPPSENDYEERRMKDFQVAFDVTAQLNDRHMVSMGIEFRQLDIFNFTINANEDWDGSTDPSDPDNPPQRPVDVSYIDVRPYEIAAYIEDKIEFANLVVRPGLRLDVLSPDLASIVDYGLGGAVRRGVATAENTGAKVRLSPRLGIAFPITEVARISFNYGQFLEYPEYSQLYNSIRTATWVPGTGYVPEDEFGFDLGFETRVGNPDIEPQRTIFYQIDGEFLITESFKMGASLFYKDIYDYVTYKRTFAGGGDAFWTLSNLDYANARGFEVRAKKLMEEHFGFTATYSFSRAIGNADDAFGSFSDWVSNSVTGIVPPKGSQPLDWDQPHSFSFTVFTEYKGFSGNLLGRFGSGLPYTRTSERGLPLGPKNSARRPWQGSIDGRFEYTFDVANNWFVRPFANVTNLLDRKNVFNVYSTTGSPDFTTDQGTQFEDAHRPFFFGPPRHITIGVHLGF